MRQVPLYESVQVNTNQVDEKSPWYIVLTEPQQEITTVWRMHELGLELYTPIVRERRPTRHRNISGHKICLLKPKPMFPGYGFCPAGWY